MGSGHAISHLPVIAGWHGQYNFTRINSFWIHELFAHKLTVWILFEFMRYILTKNVNYTTKLLGVYWFQSVRPASRVRSVAPTVLVGSISYLYILSISFRRCVTCKVSSKIQNFGQKFGGGGGGGISERRRSRVVLVLYLFPYHHHPFSSYYTTLTSYNYKENSYKLIFFQIYLKHWM